MESLVDGLKDFFLGLENPILQALVGGLFTWLLTAIGAGLVFCFKSTNRKILDMCLGFTGGVMIAASFWSLLSPAIASVEIQQELGITNLPIWFAPATGFLFGALFLYFIDKKIVVMNSKFLDYNSHFRKWILEEMKFKIIKRVPDNYFNE